MDDLKDILDENTVNEDAGEELSGGREEGEEDE